MNATPWYPSIIKYAIGAKGFYEYGTKWGKKGLGTLVCLQSNYVCTFVYP